MPVPEQIPFPFLNSDQYGIRGARPTLWGPDICQVNEGNYALGWDSTCDLAAQLSDKGLLPNSIFGFGLDIEFERLDHDEVVAGIQDQNNNFKKEYHSIRRRYAFTVTVDDVHLDYLRYVNLFETIHLYKVENGAFAQDNIIENMTIEVVGDNGDYLYVVRISFNVQGEGFEYNGCCQGVISDIPFEDDCEDPVDPPVDTVCSSYSVSITNNTGTLTATANGSPGGLPSTFTWYFDPGTGVFQVLGTGATTTLGAFGKYKVVANSGGCVAENTFNYQDPCGGFAISDMYFDGNSIDVNVGGCTQPGGMTISWDFIDSDGTETPLPNTTFSIIPLTTGNYRATVQCGTNCVDERILYVSVTECAWTLDIVEAANGETLTAQVTGCAGTPDVDWAIDRGQGSIENIVDTPTVSVNGPGLYMATVTCDGCTLKAQYLILECNVAGCGTVDIARTGQQLSAVVSPCTTSPVNITWYLNQGNGYGAAIGMGQTISITTNGMYKAVYTCGDCIVEDEFLVVDCDTCNLSASISLSDVILTLDVQGCTGTPIITWSFDDGTGEVVLPDTGLQITATNQGLYIATVNCDGCTVVVGYLFCGPDCGDPFDPGSGLPIEVC